MAFLQTKWAKWATYRPRLSFISIHYTSIIGLALLGSILLSFEDNIRYVDALFFASGAATQSGLNTIDINKLRTYQQVVLYFIPLLANPITASAIIVFVRIYWFEKKLDNLVKHPRLHRWTTVTRSRTEPNDADLEREQHGVAGRPITVLLPKSQPPSLRETPRVEVGNAQTHDAPSQTPLPTLENSAEGSSDNSHLNSEKLPLDESKQQENTQSRNSLVPFGNNCSSTHLNATDKNTAETENNASSHIAFVESQLPQKRKTGVLRIPSPREFENGVSVEDIEEEDPNPHKRDIMTGDAPTEESSVPSRVRRRLGSFSDKVISRSHLSEPAMSTGATLRGRSDSPMSRLSRRISRTQDLVSMPYLSYTPTIGRNSAFVDLTDEQREELGGLEYRALKLLAKILIAYFFFFHIFGILSLLPWIYRNPQYGKIVQGDSVGRPWWAVFTSASSFMDVGFTLTPDSMASFQDAVWILLILSFLIIIGNTAFPCMLRLIIWLMWKFAPHSWSMKAPLRFLLDHPRRCFTLLFPSGATWALAGILVLLNGADLILFILLDLRDNDVTSIPTGYRIVDGLFQAASTRTAGMTVVDIAALHPAIQVSYMVMMYISIFPIAISVRRTNVYEESALGIYAYEEEVDGKGANFIGAHLRNQLQYDLWYIFLGLFLIAVAEGGRIQNPADTAFNLFTVLFEVVSAYGTVGLSLGYPGVNTSLSGQFTAFSKVVIIAMQIRGRHRGLPYGVDRAILLPSDSLIRDQVLHHRPPFVTTGVPFTYSLSRTSNAGSNMYRARSREAGGTRPRQSQIEDISRSDTNTRTVLTYSFGFHCEDM